MRFRQRPSSPMMERHVVEFDMPSDSTDEQIRERITEMRDFGVSATTTIIRDNSGEVIGHYNVSYV